jgi:hypothetical protein
MLTCQILTFGAAPYENVQSNQKVVEYVLAGNRLPKVSQCPDELYELMQSCWKDNPRDRPNFKEILDNLVGIRGEKQQEEEDEMSMGGSQYYKTTQEEEKRENNSYSTNNLAEYQQ